MVLIAPQSMLLGLLWHVHSALPRKPRSCAPPPGLQKKKFGFISTQPGSSLTLEVKTSGAPVRAGISAVCMLPARTCPSVFLVLCSAGVFSKPAGSRRCKSRWW